MAKYTDAIHFAIHGARLLAQQKGELVHYVLNSYIGVKCRRFVTPTFDVVASDDGLALDIHRLENSNPVVMVDEKGIVYRTHGELRYILPAIIGEVVKFLVEFSLDEPKKALELGLEMEPMVVAHEIPSLFLRMNLPMKLVGDTCAVPRNLG